MKSVIVLLCFQVFVLSSFSQQFGRDFFNNLTYESARDNYKAKLEKNVFNDLIFTDNKNNKITFNNKFLSRTNPTILSNSKDQEIFFEDHITYFRKVTNRKEEFQIDMFDNWKFETNENNYKAELKKDIFNAHIFSDNKGNESSYDEKYLAKIPNHPFRTNKEQYTFFVDLIDRFFTEKNYKVDFEVDIFNKVIVSDNRGFKRESNDAYYLMPEFNVAEDTSLNEDIRIRKINNTEYAYRNTNEFARLFENKTGRWTYEDSLGNRFQVSPSTWNKLMNLYKSEDDILRHFINEYLS
jgi:hypothetical protein